MGMQNQPIPFKLNDTNLQRMIREAAADTARVFFTSHAKKRMRERKITSTQVYECLRKGVISDHARVNIKGSYQCTMTWRHAGDEVSVAAALERDDAGNWVAIVTVF
jgi:hypothetical protein